MNKYENNFYKYSEIANKPFETFEEFLNEVKKRNIKLESSNNEAIIVLGFSGNGKSTWIKNYNSNNEYAVLSMDSVQRELFAKNDRSPQSVIKLFGDRLDEILSQNKKIIIDGNFLNLLTRCILIDTIHQYGYSVTLVNLIPLFNEVFEHRKVDEINRVLHLNINIDTLPLYMKDEKVKRIVNFLEEFHNNEKKNSFIDVQIQNNCLDLNVEKIVDNNFNDISKKNIRI